NLVTRPLSNSFLSLQGASDPTPEPRYPLQMFHCSDCGLIQLLDLVDREEMFDDYAFLTATANTSLIHFDQYAKDLTQLLPLDTQPDPIVEVAIKQIQGVIRDLDGDAAREAAKANVAIREEFERSKGEAVLSMVDFIEGLHEEHKTSMDFALGRERFQKLLWVNDRINQPVEEVLELA